LKLQTITLDKQVNLDWIWINNEGFGLTMRDLD